MANGHANMTESIVMHNILRRYAAYYEQFELRRPKLGPSIFLSFTELFSSVILSVMAVLFMTTLEKHPLDVS